MAITIAKVGSDVFIQDGTHQPVIIGQHENRYVFFPDNTHADIRVGDFVRSSVAFADLSIGGSTPTDVASFKTQWATVFLNASGTGLSSVTTSTPITGDGTGGSPVTFTADATHRLVTDTEKTTWNAAVPNTRTVNGQALSSNVTVTTITGNAATATALQTSRNIDGQAFDGSASITVIAPGTHAATSKATPVDADEIPIVDSAASNVLKKTLWSAVKATLKTYFDTLYNALNVNLVDKTVSNTYTAGAKQIFGANATNSGVGFGGVTADPSTPVSGDWWYRSDLSKWSYYDGSTIRRIVTEQLAQSLSNKTAVNLILSAGVATTSIGAPTVSAGTAAGTSPTSISITGNDIAGVVNITTGSSPAGSGNIIVTLTFSATLASTPKSVQVSAANLAAAGKGYISSALDFSTASLSIRNSATLTATTAYSFTYLVIQ